MGTSSEIGKQMVNELVLDASGEKLKSAVVERLLQKAPSNSKCIFLNCEMQDTPGGMAMSDDLFAVVKPVLRGAKRVDVDMDADTFKALVALGRIVLAGMHQDHVTVDLIVDSSGSCKTFWDDGPLRRIGGGERDFKTKHKAYAYLEPWLNEVE